MHDGSIHSQVASMQVGDVKWVETTVENYQSVQRKWGLPKSRRPPELAGYVMQCNVYRAIPCAISDDVAYLVRVERKA